MNFLILQVLCRPDVAVMQSLFAHNWVCYLMLLAFLLVALFTLMNMLIGVLCTVVANAAERQKDDIFSKEVECHTSRLAKALGSDAGGSISQKDFEVIIKDPLLTTSFIELGVDVIAFADSARFLFEQCSHISYTDFGLLVAKFRGSKTASVSDVMGISRHVTMELLELESRRFDFPTLSNGSGAMRL